MKKICAVTAALLLSLTAQASAQQPDHTALIEDLGRPAVYANKGEYASNIWDLKLFDGAIYLGVGNSSNHPPNANAGPVPIIALDPATHTFSSSFTVDEEQIELYRVIDGQLVVPGHDPRQGHAKGNFYRLEQGSWKKYRTIPNGIHTYDMIAYDGDLYAALGAENDVVRSSDGGQTWSRVPMGTVPQRSSGQRYARSYALFVFEEKLWSVGRLNRGSSAEIHDRAGQGIWSWDGETAEERDDLPTEVVMPQVAEYTPYSFLNKARPHRTLAFGQALYYLGVEAHNDHQINPGGVYRARSLRRGALDIDVVRVSEGADPIWVAWRPWDLIERDGALYILASKALTPKDSSVPRSFEIGVWASRDGESWSRILYAELDTFARSMEVYEGDIYLGLGTDVRERDNFFSYTKRLLPDSGKILRLRRRDWSRCGDGFLDPLAMEACDDGAENADGVPDACKLSCELPRCGDLVVDTGEECDGTRGCNQSCKLGAEPEDAGVDVGGERADASSLKPDAFDADGGDRDTPANPPPSNAARDEGCASVGGRAPPRPTFALAACGLILFARKKKKSA